MLPRYPCSWISPTRDVKYPSVVRFLISAQNLTITADQLAGLAAFAAFGSFHLPSLEIDAHGDLPGTVARVLGGLH